MRLGDAIETVTLISGHCIWSKRKAGFHWLAEAFSNHSWNVFFITTPIRYTAWLTKDHRSQYFNLKDVNKPVFVNDRFITYIYMTFFNPLVTKYSLINKIFLPFSRIYGKYIPKMMVELIKKSDVIIFESAECLLLFDKIHRIKPDAKFIYRVSDLLEVNHVPQLIIDYEKKITPRFDLISVPSEYINKKFCHLLKVKLHYHGINKEMFDKIGLKPIEYTKYEKNIVFIGTTHFDYDFIKTAAESFPHWGFHIIGPIAKMGESPNLLFYGEMPFATIVPYIQHADVGLQNLISDQGLASFSDSLKVLQYTYCKLPIVAPVGLRSLRKNIIYYVPGDGDSVRTALERAGGFDRESIDSSNIYSWEELADLLIEEVYTN